MNKLYKNTPLAFYILTKINPIIALLGTFCLANNLKIGWVLLMGYNLSNIYVYLVRRKDFWMYSLVSILHFSFGLWAIFK